MSEVLQVLGCCEWCCCRALLSGSGRSFSRKGEENQDAKRVERLEQPEADVDKELEEEKDSKGRRI
jgi:hypothetical protein